MGRLAIRLEKDLVQTISTVNSTAKSIDGAVTDIGVDAQKVLVELRRATESAIGLVSEIQKMVAENRGPVRDFTSIGLYEMSAFIQEIRQLISCLSRVTAELRRDHAQFIFGSHQ